MDQKGKTIPLLEDRSGAETDDRCGMRYWFNRKAGPSGKGIVPKAEALALTIGRETHEDLRTIAEMEDISEDTISKAVSAILMGLTDEDRQFQKPMELLYRRLGWFIAFALYMEPKIRAEWETVHVEHEIILDRGNLWVPITPDRILRSRAKPDMLVYKEYKTTISAGTKWQQSWRYAIQLHAGIAAAQEELNEKVAFAQIMGLMKGHQAPGSWTGGPRLSHPYVWGWFNRSKGTWSHEYKTGSDWSPMPVWEYPGGLVEWVKFCGPDIAREQFPHSVPVFLDTRMLDDWTRRRASRQREIQVVEANCRTSAELRGLTFERRTNQCRPAFGDECPYLLPCWNAQAEEDPLASGLYEERTPHHDVEIVGLEDI